MATSLYLVSNSTASFTSPVNPSNANGASHASGPIDTNTQYLLQTHVTGRLAAVDIGATSVTLNMWVNEQNMTDNAAVRVVATVKNFYGITVGTLFDTTSSEASTSMAAKNWTVTATPVSIPEAGTITFQVYLSAAPSNTYQSTGTFNYAFNGNPTGLSYVRFTETITAAGAMNGGFTLSHFRKRNDDGNEVTATWAEDEDTNFSVPLDTPFRIRWQLRETNNSFAIQYAVAVTQFSRNAGPAQTSGSGYAVQNYPTTNLISGNNTTRQLTAAPSGSYVSDNNGQRATGGSIATDVAPGDYFEVEASILISSTYAQNGDVITVWPDVWNHPVTKTMLPSITVGSGGRSGTLNATLGSIYISAQAKAEASGTLSATLAPLTVAGTGTYTQYVSNGALVATLAELTAGATGTYTQYVSNATLAATLGELSLVATGTGEQATVTGTLAATLAALTLTATGGFAPKTNVLDPFNRVDENPLAVGNWGGPFTPGEKTFRVVANQAAPQP